MATRFSTHRWRSVLMFLLLAMIGGCQSSIDMNTFSATPTIAPGRIFFIRSESVQDGYQDHCDNLWSMYPDGSRLRQHTNDTPPGIGLSHFPTMDQVGTWFLLASWLTPRWNIWDYPESGFQAKGSLITQKNGSDFQPFFWVH